MASSKKSSKNIKKKSSQNKPKQTKQNKNTPRKKRKSDELYNARRRAKRALQRFEKHDFTKLSNADKKLYTQFRNELVKQIQQSYGKQKSVKETVRLLDVYSEPTKKGLSEKARKNLITQRRITNQLIGNIGDKRQAAFFYRATQRLWEGKPLSQRNRLIAEKFGGDLQAAWEYVFNQPSVKKALNLKSGGKITGSTKEAKAFYEDVQDVIKIDSPNFAPLRFKF